MLRVMGCLALLLIAAPARAEVAPRAAQETVALTLKDDRGAQVPIRVPVALYRPANAYRLYGMRPLTLWSRDRRRDLYRDAFLELATRSRLDPPADAWDSLSEQLDWLKRQDPHVLLNQAGQGLSAVRFSAPKSLPSQAELLKVVNDATRQVAALPAYRNLATLTRALGEGEPSLEVAQPVAATLRLRALATDEAEHRLQELGRALNVDRPGVDPALRDGYRLARKEFDQVRQGLWPAVAASVKSHQGRLILSAVRQVVLSNLGIWALFGYLGWQGVQSALNVEYQGQYAICLGTLAAGLQASPADQLSLARYAEYALNYQLTEALKEGQIMPLKPAGGKPAMAWQIQLTERCDELRAALR
jgi:hypothetical protein